MTQKKNYILGTMLSCSLFMLMTPLTHATSDPLLCSKSSTVSYSLTEMDYSMIDRGSTNLEKLIAKKGPNFRASVISQLQKYRNIKLQEDVRMAEILSNVISRVKNHDTSYSASITKDNSAYENALRLENNGINELLNLSASDIDALVKNSEAAKKAQEILPDLSEQIGARRTTDTDWPGRSLMRINDFVIYMKFGYLTTALDALSIDPAEFIGLGNVQDSLLNIDEMARNFTDGPLIQSKYYLYMVSSNFVVLPNGPCNSVGFFIQNPSENGDSPEYRAISQSISDAAKGKLPTTKMPTGLKSLLDKIIQDTDRRMNLSSHEDEHLSSDDIDDLKYRLHIAYLKALSMEVYDHSKASTGKEKAFLELVNDHLGNSLYGG